MALKKTFATYAQKWGYSIQVYDGPDRTGKVIDSLRWGDMDFHLMMKYQWYYEYRYALLRIKYPKNHIRKGSFSRDLKPYEEYELWKNAVIGKKRTISKYKNKLQLARDTWSSMFPIEDDELYQKAVAKIQRLEAELIELEKLYDTPTDN